MNNRDLHHYLSITPLGDILREYPLAVDFFENIRIHAPDPSVTLGALVETMDNAITEDFGLDRRDLTTALCDFLLAFSASALGTESVETLTILGGRNKSGAPEQETILLKKGEVTAIVGPTGSGKSRLLADIECLAQGDTPTTRHILINCQPVPEEKRFDMDGKLVAQLSQNMNFVMDLSVGEFLEMHARSRCATNVAHTVKTCVDCANCLAGESFDCTTKVTQLSGGQSRALMIADTAYMSASPLVLIDEIENAGIDRKRAVGVLAKRDKIVLIATHDPLLALSAHKRIVIKNGGIHRVIETSPEENRILGDIERMDAAVQQVKNKLRAGALITEMQEAHHVGHL